MPSEESHPRVSRWELAAFALRHSFKAIALGLVVAIGTAVTTEVDFTTSLAMVSTGQTAEDHQLAEGIE